MTDRGKPVLEFRGVNTHYGPVHILKNVNIKIHEGEMVCLLGGNASGKTTTLKTILGMVEPTGGEVVIDGEVTNGMSTAKVVGSSGGCTWIRCSPAPTSQMRTPSG